MKFDLQNLKPKNHALELLFAQWTPVPEEEAIPVEQCTGRVLAKSQYARFDIPVVRASTMDGVAVRSERFQNGCPDTADWKKGVDYVRADTGDDFDDAFDAVIPIEDVTLTENGGITVSPEAAQRVTPNQNVKPRGAEVRQGALLAEAGTRLTALDMAALAMGGIAAVPVWKKPRVAFLPTGSELVTVGSQLQRGQNFDTNSLMVAELLRQMGAEPVLHPIVRDDPEELRKAVDQLLPVCDILLVNAGTSKGGEDYCAKLLAEAGTLLFHGVAAVPGRPMSMAMFHEKPVVNLSGPAFAAFYSVDWAVRALVCRWLGQPLPQRQKIQVTLAEKLMTPPMFSAMTALRLTRTEQGYLALPLSVRGPRRFGSAAVLTADAVYVSALGEAPHAAGETLTVELLRDPAEIDRFKERETAASDTPEPTTPQSAVPPHHN